jgi:hypothetical protein
VSLSTFLNGREPTRLRGLLWLSLSETGVIYAGSVTSDSGGGGSFAWSATGTVDCRIDPLSAGGGGILAARVDERSTHLVTVPPGTSVTDASRFAINGRGTFEVTATREQTAEMSSSFEVLEVT